MDYFVDERAIQLLEADKYSFNVLRHIVTGPCELLMTDHERVIICASSFLYSIWIWTKEGLSEDDAEKVYQIVATQQLFCDRYRFNLKYAMAEFFMRRAAQDGLHVTMEQNMHAYECTAPIAPKECVDGVMHPCRQEDCAQLALLMERFYQEVPIIPSRSLAEYRKHAGNLIDAGRVFFWKNKDGATVSTCSVSESVDGLTRLGHVFTQPHYRRQHYAERLVYEVTRLILERGETPMLYADANYSVSNACYQKLGYLLRGSLCTLQVTVGT